MKSCKRMIAAITVLLLALGVTSTHASAPSGQITVTPSSNLADGQTVQVAGSGFAKNINLNIVECGPVQPFPRHGGWQSALCSYYTVSVITDANGSFSAQNFTVSSVIQGAYWLHGHNVSATYDCQVQNDCHIHVYSPGGGNASVNQDISFGQ